ncbi:MAG: hypothetical protein J6T35_02350 [Bacteroidales bacterium]|nr:hypothetical protein [Bacteroidales bacterium]
MKLETLSGLVVQLVLENGRVMLPQLGAFMRETVPASFSDRGFTLLPPYRRLVFRESQGNGTLLCEALSRQARLTPQRAQAEIEICVQALREQLEQENQALIPGLGRLKRTASGGLLFVQDEDLDVSGEWMALDAVSLKSQDRMAASAFHTAPESVAPKPASAPVAPTSPSAPMPEPAPAVVPAPALESEPASTPEPASVAPALEPAPASEPAPVVPAPPVMRDIPASGEEEADERHTSPWLVLLLVLLVLAVLFVALFYAGVWFFPDILDKFLYNENQLELLKYFDLTR